MQMAMHISRDGRCREAGSAGEGFAFHTLFEGADVQAVGRCLHKIGIGAFGLEGIGPSVFRPVLFHVQDFDTGHEFHKVAGARVEEVAIQDGLHSVYVNHLELDGPQAVLFLEDLSRMRAVRCQKVPYSVRRGGLQAQVIGKGHDASATIAAHHAAAAVGVVEFHGKVTAGCLTQDHEAVGAVFPAQSGDGLLLAEIVHPSLAPVQQDKVIACPGELV